MVLFKKLLFFIYNFISQRGQQPIKQALSSSSCHEGIESSDIPPAEESPAGDDHHKGTVEGGDEVMVCCCVCLSRLKEGEEKSVLPCMHEFHKMCIDRWFNVCRKTCPVCRFSMVDDDEDKFPKREALTEDMVIWFSSFHVAGF